MTGTAGPIDRFGVWLRAPARAERLALLRILVAGYGVVWLVVRAPHLRNVAGFADDRWRPPGVLSGLADPPSGSVVLMVVLLAVASGLAVLVGWRHRVSGPTFALALLLVTTWRNGWGQIFHTENLLVLHAWVLALVPASAAWSLDARRSARTPGGAVESLTSARFGWPIRVMALLTVSTYFVAGVAKIRYGGAGWLQGDVLARQIAFDNIRKAAVGSTTSPVAGLLLDARWLLTPMALSSLVVELGAPLALLSPRAARLWAGATWLFHMGIVVTMVILFAYPLSLVALSPVLLVHGEGVPWPRARQRVARRISRGWPETGSAADPARTMG